MRRAWPGPRRRGRGRGRVRARQRSGPHRPPRRGRRLPAARRSLPAPGRSPAQRGRRVALNFAYEQTADADYGDSATLLYGGAQVRPMIATRRSPTGGGRACGRAAWTRSWRGARAATRWRRGARRPGGVDHPGLAGASLAEVGSSAMACVVAGGAGCGHGRRVAGMLAAGRDTPGVRHLPRRAGARAADLRRRRAGPRRAGRARAGDRRGDRRGRVDRQRQRGVLRRGADRRSRAARRRSISRRSAA